MITIKSDLLELSVVPELGAQIVSLKDQAGNEYLAPAITPRPANLPLSASFNDGGLGGIDDCLPAIAAGPYPVDQFADWPIPDHGEVWLRPWQIQSSADEALTVSIEGLRLPYTFTRQMILDKNSLFLNYTLVNHGEVDLPVVWALHPMLQPTPQLEIEIGSPDSLLVEACNAGLEAGAQIPYPRVEVGDQGVDLRYWRSLPAGFYLKAFAPLESEAVVALKYPEWGSSLEMLTRSDHPLHLGLWLNQNGFPEDEPVAHLSLEPTFGSADSLSRSLADGSCLILKAHSQVRWTTIYRLATLKEER